MGATFKATATSDFSRSNQQYLAPQPALCPNREPLRPDLLQHTRPDVRQCAVDVRQCALPVR